jgi:hypothetical protein
MVRIHADSQWFSNTLFLLSSSKYGIKTLVVKNQKKYHSLTQARFERKKKLQYEWYLGDI